MFAFFGIAIIDNYYYREKLTRLGLLQNDNDDTDQEAAAEDHTTIAYS